MMQRKKKKKLLILSQEHESDLFPSSESLVLFVHFSVFSEHAKTQKKEKH